MTTRSSSTKPREAGGSVPQPAREALIDTLVRLLAAHSADSLSVRDVAAEAGVNHGLVHRHFGSKENLVRAAVKAASEQVHGSGGDPCLGAQSFAALRERPELVAVLARWCLDGPHDLLPLAAPPREKVDASVAALRAWLEAVGLSDVDPRLVNALGVAAILGWFAFRPYLKAGYQMTSRSDAEMQKLLERVDALLSAAST